MKKFLLTLIAIFMSSTLLLSGCGNKGLKNNPPTNAPVISNGGMSVVKGDYIYFVNGFNTYENLTKNKDNVWGKQVISAIYRAKTNNYNLTFDKNGFLLNAEVVVPKIVGTENANFFIFGDYIYYATPNMQKDKEGHLLNSRSDICRININGLNNKVLYTTESTITNLNWTMYELDGTIYALIFDNNKIVSIKANAKNPKAKVIANNADSTAFIMNNNYNKLDETANKTINNVNNFIYYTRSITKEDKDLIGYQGNILAKANINDGKEEIIQANDTFTYKIIQIKNNSLYYSKTNNTTTIETLCKKDLITNETIEIIHNHYDKLFILDANNSTFVGTDIVVIDAKNIELKNEHTSKILYTATADIKPIGLYGDLLFFIEENNINYINVRQSEIQKQTVNTNGKELKTDGNIYFDFDGKNAYYYVNYTAEDESKHYYLNKTDIQKENSDSEFLGVFAEGHTPKKPEKEEDKWIK